MTREFEVINNHSREPSVIEEAVKNNSSFAPDILRKVASGIGQKEIFLKKIDNERFDNGTKLFKS